jgi:hypothetical protein
MSHPTSAEPALYGLLAEFDHADDLVAAAKAAKAGGYTALEGYSPMPIHGLSEILGQKNQVALFTLGGAVAGLLAGFGLQYWVNMLQYPMNIAGKPDFSWPAFVVPAYETTILFGALTAAVGMLVMNGLPRPHHPLFDVPAFENASRNRFFLVIESRDPRFDLEQTRRFLEGLHPLSLAEVPL